MKFGLKMLFVVVTLAAVLTLPILNLTILLKEKWAPRNTTSLVVELPKFELTRVTTVIAVPDGGTVLRCGKLPIERDVD